MSGVYKSLQPKDVRSTPYRAHKSLITAFSSGEPVGDDCKVYQAEYTLSSSYNFFTQGVTNLDYGNPYFTGEFATTTDGYYKTAIHSQLDHLFYREYVDNTKATLGGGAPIRFQFRDLGSVAQVISYPTKKVGEGILPESLEITASGYTIRDDKYGNLVFADNGTGNGISNYDAADYDNVMISHTFNKYYRYVGEGVIGDIQQEMTYGYESMFTSFSNVAFSLVDTNGSVSAKFSGSSVMQLIATSDQKNIYNLLNKEYAIAFCIKLNTAPTGANKSVVLAKQDKITDVAVTLDGDLYTDVNTPSQFPYKIEVDSSRRLVFSKSDTVSTFTLTTSALTLGQWYDVVITRLGTTVSVYLDGTLNTSGTDTFFANTLGTAYGSKEQDCGNRCNLYVGNSYDGTKGLDGELSYFHIFDRALTAVEADNLNDNNGWFNNFCGNVFYNLGIIVLTHPKIVRQDITQMRVKGTVSMREVQVYCTVGPGEFNVTYNRSIQYWNPVHNQYEVDSRYLSSSFRPYITSIGLYNDNNELMAVAKLSTPIQTSKTTDTTFVVTFDY